MKRIFYFAAMALAACAVMVSCEKKQDNKPNTDIDQPGEVTKLATPQVSVEIDGDNIVVSWEAVENAGSYSYVFDAEAAQTTTETTVTRPASDYEAGSQHTVLVTALPAEGDDAHTASNAGVCNFTMPGVSTDPVDPVGELAEWLGTYTLTSTGSVTFTLNGNSVDFSYNPSDPVTLEISMEPSSNAEVLFVYGLSGLGVDYPLAASLFTDQQTGEVFLGLLAEDVTIMQDNEGNYIGGYPICQLSDGSLTFVSGCPYTFVFDPETLKSEALDGELDAGTTFTVVATDLFGADGQYISIYYSNYPVTIPAGEFTLEKSSASAPARSMMISAANPVVKSSVSNRLNYVVR